MLSSLKLHSFLITSLLFNTIAFAKNTISIDNKNIIIPSALPTLEDAKAFAKNEIIVTFKKDSHIFENKILETIPSFNFNKNDFTNTPNMKIFNNKFKNEITKKFQKQSFKIKGYKKLGLMHLKSQKYTSKELMEYFRSDKMKQYVKSVSKNNIIIPTKANDEYYNKLWALENTGQNINNVTGTTDADIDAPEAWAKTKGEQNVIVAVLDTGIDYRHSDLQDNMWNGEANHGYDFAADNDGNNDDDPMPDVPYDENGHYHGTHVAGILGAVSDNANGVTGVAQHISIMSLKVFRPDGYGYTSDVLEALEYISEHIDNGDNIVAINASYGGYDGNQDDPLNQAIKELGEQGVLFCTAAGNESTNIDATPSYPASYDASNIIVVAASDQNDQLASFSNYGTNNVDISAPGTNILSTYPDNQYAYLQGTSMATPYISATVALIASLYSETTVQERKAMILKGVDKKESLTNKVYSAGRLNLNNALNIENAKEDAPIEEAQEITLPVANKGSNERKWKEVDLTNGPIKFTTKGNVIVELRENNVTIISSKKSSTLQLDIPNATLKINDKGDAIFNFQEKGINLKIDHSGTIKSDLLNLNEVILPKEAFPLGTAFDMNAQHINFTLPLTNNLIF